MSGSNRGSMSTVVTAQRSALANAWENPPSPQNRSRQWSVSVIADHLTQRVGGGQLTSEPGDAVVLHRALAFDRRVEVVPAPLTVVRLRFPRHVRHGARPLVDVGRVAGGTGGDRVVGHSASTSCR